MVIRRAVDSDIGRIVDMGARFYSLTSYRAVASFDHDAVRALAEHLLREGVLLVAETDSDVIGMAGLVLAPLPFNPAAMFAHEVMWWVEPQARGLGAGRALVEAIETACREAGADAIQMVHLSSSPPEAAAIYERAGYSHTESCFTKRL